MGVEGGRGKVGEEGGGDKLGGHTWALTPVSCLTHNWGRINPVHHAPSSLVEPRLASLSAVPSRHDEWPSSPGDFGGKGPNTSIPLVDIQPS